MKTFILNLIALLLVFLTSACNPNPNQEINVIQTEAIAMTSEDDVKNSQVSVCLVPNVVGLDQSAAENSLTNLGLRIVKSNQYSDTSPAGIILSQDPPAQTKLEPCEGDVILVTSLGGLPEPTDIPIPISTATPIATPTVTPIPTSTPTPEPVRSIRSNNFVFEIDSCVMQGSTAVCSFWITNVSDSNQELTLSSHSSPWNRAEMYDNLGNFYEQQSVTLANLQDSYTVSLLLVTNVKTKGSVTFKEIAEQASSVALLRMSHYDGEERLWVEFQNLSLVRQ
jgi:hypothetical protein